MGYLVCLNCHKVFDEADAVTETFHHTEDEYGGEEYFQSCPYCGHTDMENAAYCVRCGEPTEYGKLHGGYYCDECMKEVDTPTRRLLFIRAEYEGYADFIHEHLSKMGADVYD